MPLPKTLIGLGVLAVFAPLAAAGGGDAICIKTAKAQRRAAMLELKDDFHVAMATCLNLTDPEEKEECQDEAKDEYLEGKQLAHEQYQARLDLCGLLEDDAYDPEIDPDDFSTLIDNPYLPFPVGAEWVYESETEEGLETIVVTVLPETREILGVECVSVRDVVSLEGVPVEDTIDWYAQDLEGNVWYFGEISFNFEDGYVEDIEGSWLAGKDGAKPGKVMLGTPVVDETYRQEWLLGDAEDAATVLDLDASVTLGLITYDHCIETGDFLPPEPDAYEHKFYAPGIGFIYETKEGSDETVELISHTGV